MAEFVLGAGRVYWEPCASTATPKGDEVLIAETPGFAYSVKSTFAQEFSSDGPMAELAASAPTKIERTGKFSTKDVSSRNLALFSIATAGTQSTTTGAVTADPVNGGVAVAAGHYYQIGLSVVAKVGVRGISAFALKTGGATHTLTTDYTVDLTLGRIFIPVGSAAAGSIVTADFTKATTSWEHITTNDAVPEGALRFIADNTFGTNRDYYFPSVSLGPSGDNALKSRDKYQELSFDFEIRKPATGSAIYIDGRPA